MLVISFKKLTITQKINEIEKKLLITIMINNLLLQNLIKKTGENFAARLAEANLATKSDISNVVNKTDFDDKLKNSNKNVTSNKTKHLLVENEF